MKTKNLFIVAFLFLFASSISAQDMKHYYGGWLGGGYSSFMHNIDYFDNYGSTLGIQSYNPQQYGSSVPGGFGGALGLGYELNIGSFLLQTGAEFSYLSSTTKFNNLHFERAWSINPQTISETHWKYDFEKNYTDKQRAGFVQIPLIAGAKIGRFYGLAGAKYGINIFGNYTASNKYSTTLMGEQLPDEMESTLDNYIKNGVAIEKNKGGSGTLKFSQNLILSAEVGVTLDEWIYPKPRARRNATRPLPVPVRPSFRVALFADYGLFNLIKNNSGNAELINYYQTPYLDEEQGTQLSRVETPLDLATNQLFNTNNAKDKSVNSLITGIKLTVMMPVREKVKRRTPATRAQRPQRPQRPQLTSSTFYARIIDAETKQSLAANYQMIDEKTKNEVFSGVTDANNGFIENQLNSAGKYSFLVDKDGYVYYSGSITTVSNDTLIVELQQTKKETKVVLEDLFFDVDKWVIKSDSELTLNNLLDYLTDNPDVSINILGHTDDTGTPQHNIRLSENRAKAVFTWLTKAGIDKDRLSYEGKGQDEPIDTNDTEEGRSKNRRVEFVIQ